MTEALLIVIALFLAALVFVSMKGQRTEQVAVARSFKPKTKDHTFTEGPQAVRSEPWGAGEACSVCGNLKDACAGRK